MSHLRFWNALVIRLPLSPEKNNNPSVPLTCFSTVKNKNPNLSIFLNKDLKLFPPSLVYFASAA